MYYYVHENKTTAISYFISRVFGFGELAQECIIYQYTVTSLSLVVGQIR